MPNVTRRQFLKLSTLVSGTLAGQSLLTACGQNPPAGPTAAAGEPLLGTFTPTVEPT
jgi:hypothetical protein